VVRDGRKKKQLVQQREEVTVQRRRTGAKRASKNRTQKALSRTRMGGWAEKEKISS